MRCPKCQHQVGDKARFCDDCGAALHTDCKLCRSALAPEAKYCPTCGTLTPLGRQSMPPHDTMHWGENRQLTVVFSDLVDSTRLAQELDPEAYRDAIQAYQHAAAQVVERYEGYIARYLGDGILIYFGFPLAQDDAAERAVNAAYDIVHALEALNIKRKRSGEAELAVRVGVHTGSAVVSAVGNPQRPDIQVLGDAINIASRIQEQAPVDSVVISQASLRLVSGLFITEALGEHSLKGVMEPMPLYRVKQRSGVRSRLEAAIHLTPLVGRDQPLASMLDAWQASRNGKGRSILISGEPGMGKSRVLHAFHEQLAETPHTWLECRGTQLDKGTAFKPVAELMRRSLRLEESADQATRLERLEQGIRNVEGDLAFWVPLLAPLLGIQRPAGYASPALGVERRHEEIVRVLVTWLLDLAAHQGLVVVVEDLHWCDRSTLEVLDQLVCDAHKSQLLVLASTRPSHPMQFLCESAIEEITLPPLQQDQVLRMVDAISPSRLPDAARRLIGERAGGVPLFVEELTKSVLESELLDEQHGSLQLRQDPGSLATNIPASLNDLLMARLDQLGPARQIAQIGSVIGQEFHYLLLASLCDRDETELQAQLQRLTDAQLLYQRGQPPQAVYLFKHSLIQDAAYGSLLRSSRRELHSRIADSLIDLCEHRLAPDPGLIAWHLEHARRTEQAAQYYQQAAALVESRSAIRETYEISRHALDMLVALPSTPETQQQRMQLMMSLGRGVIAYKGYAHPETGEICRMGLELARRAGDPLHESLSLTGLCVHHLFRAEFTPCQDTARRLIHNATQHEMPFFNIVGQYHLGCAHLYQGSFDEALRYLDRSIELFTPPLKKACVQMIGQDLHVNALALKVWPAWIQGDSAGAMQFNAAALEVAQSADSAMTLCHVLIQAARLQQMQGDYPAMLRTARKVLDIAEHHSIAVWREVARFSIGAAQCGLEQHAAGLKAMHDGIQGLMSMGTRGLCPFYLGVYAEACIQAGHVRAGHKALELALKLAADTDGHIWTSELLRLQGDLVLRQSGRRSDALLLWRQAEALAQQQNAATLMQRISQRIRRIELPALRPPLSGAAELSAPLSG